MNAPLSSPPRSTGVSRAFDDVLAGLEVIRIADRSAAGDEDRLAWLDAVSEAERRVAALRTILIAEADEAGSAMRARRMHLQDWLARSGQETARQATGAVWRARDFDQRPQVRDAAAQGRITMRQAAAINAALNELPAIMEGASRHRAEDLMLAAADHTPAEKLRSMTDRVVREVAPQLSPTREEIAERLEARDARARARRFLRFGPEVDGSLDFSGSLPLVDGRRLQQLVEAVADRSYRSAKDAHDRVRLRETPQQRLADALMTVVGVAEAVEKGSSGAVRLPAASTRLTVVMSYEDLVDRATGAGLLTDGSAVAPGELRRLACSAEIVPVVLGTDSTILDVGRTVRLAPPALRFAVGLRDGGCAFPGCTAPVRHCDIHHITPWQDGGPTSLDNTVALCRTHHGLIEPTPAATADDGTTVVVDQWEVRLDRRGLPEFIPPAASDPTRTPIRRKASHVQELLDTG